MKKMRFLVMAIVAVSVLAASTLSAMAMAVTDWDGGSIQAEGYGTLPETARNPGQAKILARRAAIVDAYRNLAEQVQGVNVNAETTVKDMAVQSDVIMTKVSALVKGARVISEEMSNDGSYKVVMQIPMYGVSGSLASAVMPVSEQKVAFPAPAVNVSVAVNAPAVPGALPATQIPTTGSSAAAVPASAMNLKAAGGYTGLVVDCSGLALNPVMSPVIKNAGGEAIYGYKNLDYQKVTAYGMAAYTRNTSTISRAGSNPLIVKAMSLENHNSYPVLAVADANRVLVENQASHFLDNCSVVFVR